MQNFMKTIISAVQTWTKGEIKEVQAWIKEKIKESTADWNENDVSSPRYIKNRTHWIDDKETIIVKKQDFQFREIIGWDGYYRCTSELNIQLIDNQEYSVYWDGTVYKAIAKNRYGYGDAFELGAAEDNSYDYSKFPFTIYYEPGYLVITTLSTSTSHEIGISIITSEIHKIDKKFLPDDFGNNNNILNGSALGSIRTINAAEESSNYTMGDSSFAEGWNTTASGDYSHAEGWHTTASGAASHAEGWDTIASGDNSHTEGEDTKALGTNSHAEGEYTVASGDKSHAEGSYTTASGYYSHAEGIHTTASGSNSHAEGYETTASGSNSHAEGEGTVTSGDKSHAEGMYTTASGYYSHAEGYGKYANHYISGDANTTTYTIDSIYQLFVGATVRLDKNYNTAKIMSIDSSNRTIVVDKTLSETALNNEYVLIYLSGALGDRSHVEGYYTTASGEDSHAEGWKTIASGIRSHTEGRETTASGIASHAEGHGTTASEDNSHAEGMYTTASGYCSHAEGGYTTALGIRSHAEGSYTTASGRSQHVQGEYNIIDTLYDANDSTKRAKYAHIVGNGESSTKRSNAHTLDWKGNAWYQGDVYVGGTGQDEGERLAKVSELPSIDGLASEEYVNTQVANLVNSAPDKLNTLDELAAALGDDENFANTITTQIANKANRDELPIIDTTLSNAGQVADAKTVGDALLTINNKFAEQISSTNIVHGDSNILLSNIIENYILNIDYENLLAFDTSEIVFEASNTTSVLGQAILGQMILG